MVLSNISVYYTKKILNIPITIIKIDSVTVVNISSLTIHNTIFQNNILEIKSANFLRLSHVDIRHTYSYSGTFLNAV